eukprot:m.258623 g.258623  ORF g.258623 m.258623 type:complete len:504 (+) comp15546_c0_seq2:241-1752(+)
MEKRTAAPFVASPLITTLALLLAISSFSPSCQARHLKKAPNVLIINIDDVGSDHFSFYGSNLTLTPNIDAFEKSSVRFMNFFAQPLCGPSRAALFSGRWPSDTGIIGNAHRTQTALDVSECTIASVFREGGYKTAIFGKVHSLAYLNYDLDKTCGYDMWSVWHRSSSRYRGSSLMSNLHVGDVVSRTSLRQAAFRHSTGPLQEIQLPHEAYMPHVNRDLVLAYLRRHAEAQEHHPNKSPPFFLYWPLVLAHGDGSKPARDTLPFPDMFPSNTNESTEVYRARINVADELIGHVLHSVETSNLANNTIVLLLSDNGTPRNYFGDYHGIPQRGKKKHALPDGGVRVLGLLRYPSVTKHAVIDDMVSMTDVIPTLMEATGISNFPADKDPSTGKSFWKAALTGKNQNPERWVFTFSENRLPSAVVHSREWKMGSDGSVFKREDFFNLTIRSPRSVCLHGLLPMAQDLFVKAIDAGTTFTIPGTTAPLSSICTLQCDPVTGVPQCVD